MNTKARRLCVTWLVAILATGMIPVAVCARKPLSPSASEIRKWIADARMAFSAEIVLTW